MGLRLRLTPLQQVVEDSFVQLPGMMFIGVAQRRSFGRIGDTQMTQLSLACRQPTGNLAQALRVTQLAEQHRDHLRPTGKTACVPLGFVPLYRSLKLKARNQLQNLTEYPALAGLDWRGKHLR